MPSLGAAMGRRCTISHQLLPGALTAEEVPALLGGVIETNFTVGEDLRRLFESATLLDQVYGVELEQEGDIVEGFLLLSLVDALTHPYLQLDPVKWMGLNYGFDRVRFLKPARTTDLLRLRAEICEVKAKGAGFLVKLACSFFVVSGAEPQLAAVAEWLVFATPRLEGGRIS